MNRCKECRHWGVVGTYTLPDGSTHQYGRPYFSGIGYRQCLKLEEETDQDGEPCAGNAHLGTREDFGCVLWEGSDV